MLKGTLDDFTLPDIFRLMSLAKKTGKLDVTRSAGRGTVFFREGDVYYAESSVAREPLGQKLIKAGVLKESQLMKALDEHASSGVRVGEVLVNSGAITPEELQRAVQEQIEDAVFDLLRWELGEFNWEPGVVVDIEVPISVSGENLIMEASRKLDELEVILRKIPSEHAILTMAARPPEGAVEINITPEEWRLLVLVDGSRSVHEIAEMVGLDDLSAMRSFYGLVSAGLVEASEPPSEREGARADERDDAEPEPVMEAEPEPEPEPVMEAEPEPEPVMEAEPEPEPVMEAEPEPEPEPVMEAEPEPEPESPADRVLDEFGSIGSDTVFDSEPEAAPASRHEDESFDLDEELENAEDTFGVGIDPASIMDVEEGADPEPAPALSLDEEDTSTEAPESFDVNAFDHPGPDELVTRTPDGDSFLDDLLGAGPSAAQPAPPAPQPPPAGPPPAAPDRQEAQAPPPAPAEEPEPAEASQEVDRATVVRELAGLFDDDDVERIRPMRSPSTPKGEDAGDTEEDSRKRVEDDDQVTKGLINRLIDGVKGL